MVMRRWHEMTALLDGLDLGVEESEDFVIHHYHCYDYWVE